MAKTMLINMAEPEECRIAVVDNGNLEEVYLERDFENQHVGNIYLGKVINVEPSMQAAFIDFGAERNGFLHVSDICFESVLSEEQMEKLGIKPKIRSEDEAEDETEGDEAAESDSEEASPAVVETAETVSTEGAEEAEAPARKKRRRRRRRRRSGESSETSPDTVREDREDASAPTQDSESPAVMTSAPEATAAPAAETPADKDDTPAKTVKKAAKKVAKKKTAKTTAEKATKKTAKKTAKKTTKKTTVKKTVKKTTAKKTTAKKTTAKKASANRRPAGTSKKTVDNAEGERSEIRSPVEERRRRGGRSRGGRSEGNGNGNGGGGRRGGRDGGSRKNVAIQDVLKKGQMIVVQVTREAIDHKGAQLTNFLSLAGRSLVLTPHQTRVGISRKIQHGQERGRLKDFLKELDVPKDMGCIMRTSGIGLELKDFKRDLKVLLTRHEKILSAAGTKKKPVLLFEEANLAIRALRDVYTDDIKSIIVDDESGEKKVRGWLRSMIPGAAKKLHLHTDSRPLFAKFGIEESFSKLFLPRVELPGGASVVIEQTEAVVTIDVNTARMKDKDQNTAIFNANKAAAKEIPRQLRLRDLGGLIICDFIDMSINDHRRKIEKLFADELKKDRARVKCSKISQFGIIEVSRQRMRQSVERATSETCPTCQGYGMILNPATAALKVLRQIRFGVGNNSVDTVRVTAQPDVVEFLQNEKRQKLLDLEQKFDTIIRLHGDPQKGREDSDVRFLDGDGRAVKMT